MTEPELEKIASDKYYDIQDPASFGGRERLFRSMKQYGWNRNDVEKFLARQNTYTLHRERRYKFSRNKIITYHKDYQHQVDLMDMQKYKNQNDGYKFVLVVIDCFTRFCWLMPLKSKDAEAVCAAFEKLYTDKAPLPLRINSDRGTEFVARRMKDWFKEHNIHFFTTQGKGFKCAMVERLIRTLKYRMFRSFERKGQYRYIDDLDKLADSYNNSIHRMINMTPAEARQADPNQLPMNYETNENGLERKFAVGDQVRIPYDRDKMDRGFWKTFQDRVFTINRVLRQHDVPLYELKDHDDRIQARRFYGHELVRVEDVLYRIQAEHGRRRRNGRTQVLVSWMGYPDSVRTWIDESEITDAI